MLRKIFKRVHPHKQDQIKVKVDPIDSRMICIRLFVNDWQQARIICILESSSSILIGDILHTKKGADYQKGYGSRMMEKLLDFAKSNGYTYIHGNLSVVDLDHKERLHHFYQKFGFKITEYSELKDNWYGKIELYL